MRVLIMGRLPSITENIAAKLSDMPVYWAGATNQNEVETALAEHSDIALAIMGAGLNDGVRGELISLIAAKRPDLSIHLKDRSSGPQGMAPFVRVLVDAMLLRPAGAEQPR